jgi:CubicO group peptidase (beta-lactamase class C family)
MKKWIILIFFIPCFAYSQPAKNTEQRLDSLFQAIFKSGEPGGAVLLVKNGMIIYKKGFGLADMRTKKAITSKTLFNVGSITKTFVAYGILRLAQDGKLSLDDDLYKYFPDFKNPVIARKIKLYHLLTHTSGLPDSRKVEEDSVFYLTAKDEENFAPIKQDEKLNFEPGEQFQYSNPAFNGLALIIEKVTGKKWQNYINEIIFKPAGMKHSTITDGPYPEKGVSHGYLFDGKIFIENDYGEEPTFAAAGNGGVWSSVEELWKYEQAIQQHIFLNADWINKSRTVFKFPNWKGAKPPFIGLSWFLSPGFTGHTGSQGGFRSDYAWWPEQNVFYVLLCNVPRPVAEIREKVLTIVK